MPFVIQTPAMEVKVLGTRFNIKAYPNESTTETSVIRGRVEISPRKRPGEKFVLNANEKLVLSNSQIQNEKDLVLLLADLFRFALFSVGTVIATKAR